MPPGIGLQGAYGAAASGDFAEKLLEKLIADRLREEEKRIAEDEREYRRDQKDQERSDKQEQERYSRSQDKAAGERQSALDRHQRNREGVADMERQRETMDADQARRGVAEALGMLPEGPGKRRAILRTRGVQLDQHEAETPDEHRAHQDEEATRGLTDYEARKRIDARHREPDKPEYEWVTRGGQATQIRKGTAQQGDAPHKSESAGDQKAGMSAFVINQIDELSKKINTGKGPTAKARGAIRGVAGAMNLDDDASTYDSLVQFATPLVARALGHTGVLTQQDVDSVRAAFPKKGDSESLRARKIEQLRAIGSGANGQARESAPTEYDYVPGKGLTPRKR